MNFGATSAGVMSIIVFILLGVAAFCFSHRLFNSTGVGAIVGLCLGVTGAVIAGVLCSRLGARDAAVLTIVGISGATLPLAVYRTGFREPRYRGHDST